MDLRNAVIKYEGYKEHREYSLENTWKRIENHVDRVGITRIADITGLDRIGIPVYNAIVPMSCDDISVYNGKGITKLHAKTSAVMEAIERYSAWLPMRPNTVGSYKECTKKYGESMVLEPGEMNIPLGNKYHDDIPISWLWGYDIINLKDILVPHFSVGYHNNYHEVTPFVYASSNGLASGNSTEEAICHALYELIERDDLTMATVTCGSIPMTLKAGRLGSCDYGKSESYLKDIHPSIDMQTLPDTAKRLFNQFTSVGIGIELKYISGDSGVPSILASVYENLGDAFSQMHQGIGTNASAEVACIRALTEAAQSRVVDIQAMREDIQLAGTPVPKWSEHARRSSAFRADLWVVQSSKKQLSFSDIPSFESKDIISDLNYALDGLKKCGLNRAIVIDVSPPDIPVCVVRVLVPGIESYSIDKGKLGTRSAQCWTSRINELKDLGYLSKGK